MLSYLLFGAALVVLIPLLILAAGALSGLAGLMGRLAQAITQAHPAKPVHRG